jgi:hypothetical protein
LQIWHLRHDDLIRISPTVETPLRDLNPTVRQFLEASDDAALAHPQLVADLFYGWKAVATVFSAGMSGEREQDQIRAMVFPSRAPLLVSRSILSHEFFSLVTHASARRVSFIPSM